MSSKLYTTGIEQRTLSAILSRELKASNSKTVFAACAYTSIYGAVYLSKLCASRKLSHVSLVTDIRDCITHPAALQHGMDQGWNIRVVNRSQGTFHPKIFVGGLGVSNGLPKSSRTFVVGSGNLSRGGLKSNVECGFSFGGAKDIGAAEQVFGNLWGLGKPLTHLELKRYEKRFRERNRDRSPKDLSVLGVSDEPDPTDTESVKGSKAPTHKSIDPEVAQAAWAGLESFTGEYTLQLEFPRDAGLVLQRIFADVTKGSYAPLVCEDGETREMKYAYYDDNAMFRLNIPNEVPGISEVRATKKGLAVVEYDSEKSSEIRLRICRTSESVNQEQARSFAMGTWGKTSTRFYGWY